MKKTISAIVAVAFGLFGPLSAKQAIVESGTAVFEYDGVGYWECADEDVHSVVYAPYRYHIVETPSGNLIRTENWDVKTVTGVVEGLESGHIWVRTHNVAPAVIRSTSGDMVQYTFKAKFISDTGPTIIVHETYHVTYNANGEKTVEKGEVRCIEQK